MQRRGSRRVGRSTCQPCFAFVDLLANEQSIVVAIELVAPLECALRKSRVFPHPFKVALKRLSQGLQTSGEGPIGRKEDYIEPREVLRYRRNRSCQPFNWNNFLRLARRLLDLPAKYLGLYSARRNHGDHGIALLDQDSDALLPIFGSRDRCQVDERLKAPDLQ